MISAVPRSRLHQTRSGFISFLGVEDNANGSRRLFRILGLAGETKVPGAVRHCVEPMKPRFQGPVSWGENGPLSGFASRLSPHAWSRKAMTSWGFGSASSLETRSQ